MSQGTNSDRQDRTGRAARSALWLVALGVFVVAAGWGVARLVPAPRPKPVSVDPVQKLLVERKKLDETVWADEVLAQEYEDTFVKLWDDLRATEEKSELLAQFPFETLVLGKPQSTRQTDLGIQVTQYGGEGTRMDPATWGAFLKGLREKGLRLVETEWHHSRFEPRRDGAVRSTVAVVLHVEDASQQKRYVVRGDLLVEWAPRPSKNDPPRPRVLDASKMVVLERQGEPVFRRRATLNPWPRAWEARRTLALILHDLDGDGLSELILPTSNTVYWNRGNWRFEAASFLAEPPADRQSQLMVGLMADLDGDGRTDFLGAGDRLSLYTAADGGRFPSPGQPIDAIKSLDKPMVLTAGDIDKDGDLDVWVAQYKDPYVNGQMPTPFYDAKDGSPAYLLRNDGKGHFTDVTEEAGLAPKRGRRTYSSSFVDLDDGDLDLITVSDFSGLDVYRNDGRGHFTDVTDTFVDERHAFGMSHTFADYNLDGKVDLYMVGMGSTTARRLTALGLGRSDAPDITRMRDLMGYGNRMYASTPAGLRQVPFNDQVARTGWSWGSASSDIDNDGDPDLFVANGHISNKTAKDYCSRYWTQDIYVGNSKPDPKLFQFFSAVIKQEQEPVSWNGFEHDCLLLNESGRGFLNVGYLMNVAFEFDSRNVATDDLDGDGRMDLIVVQKPLEDPPVLHLVQNVGSYGNHWIGLRLDAPGTPSSPLGAKVVAVAAGAPHVTVVVAGDSFMTQQAPVVHFGLAHAERVDQLEFHWPNGSKTTIEHPALDRYHTIKGDSQLTRAPQPGARREPGTRSSPPAGPDRATRD
jgi:hypothetical protein